MSDQHIEIEGTVDKVVKGGFIVYLESLDDTRFCRISGKIRKYKIRILTGDKVTVKLSVYDPQGQGIITFRQG